MPRVLALDLSVTSTGVAHPDGVATFCPKADAKRPLERLVEHRDFIEELLRTAEPDVAMIEGYSYGQGRGTSNAHSGGEVGGIVRLYLHDYDVPFAVVAPATLKKYATGNGGAKKEAVFAAAIRRLGYQGTSTDEADALWLYAMAKDHYGEPLCELPKVHREALTKVEWPALANNAHPLANNVQAAAGA